MLRYSTKVYTADHLWEGIISSVSRGIGRLILKKGSPWLFVKAGEWQVVGTDKHKEWYWREKNKTKNLLLCQQTFAVLLSLWQVATTEIPMSCTCTKPDYDSHFVAQIPWGTQNTDVRFQSLIKTESNTTMKSFLSTSACAYIANCKKELLAVIKWMDGTLI